jgi:hypothetical protein
MHQDMASIVEVMRALLYITMVQILHSAPNPVGAVHHYLLDFAHL